MDLMALPVLWAQAQPAGANPNSMMLLALRRWCSSLTLSSPQLVPSLHGLWATFAGLAVLFVLVLFFQGPTKVLKQLFDLALDAGNELLHAIKLYEDAVRAHSFECSSDAK